MGLNELLFSAGAWPYDRMTRHALWREHCASMVPHFPQVDGRRIVLDLGCGPGVSALAFKERAPADMVVGLDLSLQMVRIARRHDTDRRCGWLLGDALHLPLPDASVDAVTGHSFLYLVPDRRGALREILRVLRPGGRLVLLEPHKQGWLRDARSIWRLLLRAGPGFAFTMSAWRVVATVKGAFAPGDLEALFTQEGFSAPETDPTLQGLGWLARATRG